MAWAVVKGEDNDSWIWYLQHVEQFVEKLDGNKLTIISNQHKVKHSFVLLTL